LDPLFGAKNLYSPRIQGLGTLLRRTRLTTHTIEAHLSTVRYIVGNIKGCQGGDQIAHWTAAGLLEAEKEIRRVRGYCKHLL